MEIGCSSPGNLICFSFMLCLSVGVGSQALVPPSTVRFAPVMNAASRTGHEGNKGGDLIDRAIAT